MSLAIARYREYSPMAALKSHVRALFTFAAGAEDRVRSVAQGERKYTCAIERGGGDPFWSNLFADAHASLVWCAGEAYSIEGLWYPSRPHAHVIGPMTRSLRTLPGGSFRQIGAYFTAGGVADLVGFPLWELTDKVAALESLWGAGAVQLDERLQELASDAERVAAVEAALLRRLASRRRRRSGFVLARLTAWAERQGGRCSVEEMAALGGVSRQCLRRAFQDQVGINPKLFLRLTRFRACLMAASKNEQWADLAACAGYTDQSHMIADFRRFSGWTPAGLVRSNTFHPFRWSL
jgi:AraC-like DNA-binding protein